MNKEELKIILRNDFSNDIRPLIIKNKCEYCGSDEELHLHHKNTFSRQLKVCLDILKLDKDEFDKNDVNIIRNYMLGSQLRNKNITLCKKCHIEIHKKRNSIRIELKKKRREYFLKNLPHEYIGVKLTKDMKRRIMDVCRVYYNDSFLGVKEDLLKNGYYILNKNGIYIYSEYKDECIDNFEELNNYLLGIVGKKLYNEEKYELINMINSRCNGRQQKSYSKLNEYLVTKGFNFNIIPKKSGNIRYWIVVKCEL